MGRAAGSVRVAWEAGRDTAPGVVRSYRVYWYDAPAAAWRLGATTSAAVRNATVYRLDTNTMYTFAVTTVDAAGNESERSPAVSGSTDVTPPLRMAAPTLGLSGLDWVDLNWSAATDNVGVTIYEVLRYDAGAWRSLMSVNVPTVQGLVGGLWPGTDYRLAVRAWDAAGNASIISPLTTLRTAGLLPAPTQPMNVRLARNGCSVTPGWDVVTYASSYEFWQRVGTGNWTLVGVNKVGATAAMPARTIRSGPVYEFRVRARNSTGFSAFSSIVTAAC